MKNTFKLFGVIAIAAIIGFSFATCDNDDGGGDIVNKAGEAWVGSQPYSSGRFGYIFKSNGDFDGISEEIPNFWVNEIRGTYSTNGNKLSMTYSYIDDDLYIDDDDREPHTTTLTYSVSGKTLSLTMAYGSMSQTATLTKMNISSVGVFTPPSNSIPLTNRQWKDGRITNVGGYEIYSFTVNSGNKYYVWSNGKYDGDDTKTLNARIKAYHSNGTELFYEDYVSYYYPESFTAPANGTVYLYVTAGYSTETGTFAIVYSSTDSTRP